MGLHDFLPLIAPGYSPDAAIKALGGEEACKNPFHSVHIAQKDIANIGVKRMDALERGYGPQKSFHGAAHSATHRSEDSHSH